jgi:hypothetical protein
MAGKSLISTFTGHVLTRAGKSGFMSYRRAWGLQGTALQFLAGINMLGNKERCNTDQYNKQHTDD